MRRAANPYHSSSASARRLTSAIICGLSASATLVRLDAYQEPHGGSDDSGERLAGTTRSVTIDDPGFVPEPYPPLTRERCRHRRPTRERRRRLTLTRSLLHPGRAKGSTRRTRHDTGIRLLLNEGPDPSLGRSRRRPRVNDHSSGVRQPAAAACVASFPASVRLLCPGDPAATWLSGT
jgi:hypothetical protein